jgi:hypothetical protein
MHSLFGAVRIYVETLSRSDGDLPLSDDGPLPSSREGDWALWARKGEIGDPLYPRMPLSRVIGAVHVAAGPRLPR